MGFILTTLNEASDPPPEIIVLTLYNPESGGFTGRWIGQMNDEIRSTARRNGASVAEADQAFRGNTAEYLRRYESGERDIHPNDRGHAALARALTQAGSPAPETPQETARGRIS